MKKIQITLIALLISTLGHAQQWTGSSSSTGLITRLGDISVANDNARLTDVGSDRAALDLFDQDDAEFLRLYASGGHAYFRVQGSSPGAMIFYPGNSEHVRFTANGYVGIGTPNPADKLHIDLDNNGEFIFENMGSAAAQIRNRTGNLILNAQAVELEDNTGEVMRIVGGKIGIGTTNPKSKLAVNGEIRATKVKVLTDISVPDYVFEPDYDLPSLKTVKAFITEHKHLPEIPSAAEIEADGMELADMNLRLLKKVEELTLYQIELLERLEKAEAEIKSLKKK